MVRPVAGDLPEQVKNNQSVNMAAGNGGQKMSQYPWFTVYEVSHKSWSLTIRLVIKRLPFVQWKTLYFFTETS